MTDRSTVDVLSLEEFRVKLEARLAEISSVLTKLRSKVDEPPKLGTFIDAKICAGTYQVECHRSVERAERLRDALTAARDATQAIATNYRTAEARNNANATEIASALGGVDRALKGQADV
jgi:hypothetical protein